MDLKDFRAQYPSYNDLSDDQVVDALHKKFYSDLPREAVAAKLKGGASVAPEQGDTSRGFKHAMGEVVPLLKGSVGLVGATAENIFGEGGASTALKNWGLHGYEEGMGKLQATAKPTDELTTAWDRAKEGDVGALVDWAQYGLGYAAGQALQAGAMAVVGGVIGSTAAPGPGTAAGAVVGAVESGAVKATAQRVIGNLVSRQATKMVEEQATKQGVRLTAEELAARIAAPEIQQLATKQVAITIGQVTGVTGYAGVQEAGSIYPEAEQQAAAEGRKLDGADLARVWGTTAAAAGLEGAADMIGLGAVTGKIRVPGAGGRVVRGATGAGIGVAGEGVTEAAQTGLERIGAGQSLTDDAAVKDYINSAGLGALGGGAIGGAAGAIQSPARKPLSSHEALNAVRDAATVEDAIAAADQLAGSIDDVTAEVDNYLAAAGIDKPIRTPAPREQADAIDREADLLAQAGITPEARDVLFDKASKLEQQADQLVANPNASDADVAQEAGMRQEAQELRRQAYSAQEPGTQFERDQALEQIAATKPTPQPGAANGYEDLSPMTSMRAAHNRLTVLRDQARLEGIDPMRLVLVPHPTTKNAVAVRMLPSTEQATAQVPREVQPQAPLAEVQNRIESSALAGEETQRRAEDQPRQELITRTLQAIEARGGVASPEEARIVQEYRGGKPYDRVDPALSTGAALSTDDRLTQATGIPLVKPARSTEVQGKETQRFAEMQGEAVDRQAATTRANEASAAAQQKQREVRQQYQQVGETALLDAAGRPVAAPAAADVQAAMKVPPFQRTADQKVLLDQARGSYSVEQMRQMQDSATAPFNLSATDKTSLVRLGANVKLSTPRAGTLSVTANGQTHNVVLAENRALGQPGRLAVQIARVFGKKVQAFSSDTLGDGFVHDSQPDTIYLNTKGGINPLAVFGHELTHMLKRDHGEAYTALEAIVQRGLTDEQRTAHEKDYGVGANTEELVADLVGNRFAEPAFWTETFNEIRGVSPTVVQRMAQAIYNAIDKIVRVISQPGFRADAIIGERLQEVRAAVKQAVKDYAGTRREAAVAQNADNTLGAFKQPAKREVQPPKTRVEQQRQAIDRGEAPRGRREVQLERVGPPVSRKAGAVEEVRRGELARASADRETYSARPQQPGAVTVDATHYGRQAGLSELSADKYGSGAKGAEFRRVEFEPELRKRIYFYGNERGEAPRGESGVGNNVYTLKLGNLYQVGKNADADTRVSELRRSFVKEGDDVATAFEKAVIAAGFDGFYDPKFTPDGAGVLLGLDKVPAQFVWARGAMVKASAPRVTVNIGLNVNDGSKLTPEEAKVAIEAQGVKILNSQVAQSNTEPTLIAQLSRPLTADEADRVSSALRQEAIAQLVDGEGELYGPQAENWRPFNPDYFLSFDEGKLSPDRKVAGYAAIEKHLTPAEREKLTARTAENLVTLFKGLPPIDEFAAVAWAGRAKRGWYKESARAIGQVFGPDAPRFAALLASLSPQSSVQDNLTNALQVWRAWTAAGRPTSRDEIVDIMGASVQGDKGAASVLGAWVNNSVRALSNDDPTKTVLSGAKVDSFMRNLVGNVEEVTNDTWMANFALVEQKIFNTGQDKNNMRGKSPGYVAMSAKVRAAATRLTDLTGEEWTPAEVQETIWSWAKTLYEAQVEGQTARDILYNEELTDDMIRSTPDFKGLFHDDKYEAILRDAGYGDQLSRLSDEPATGEAGGAEGQAAPFDSETQSRLTDRAAARLEKLKQRGDEARASTARAPVPTPEAAEQALLELKLPILSDSDIGVYNVRRFDGGAFNPKVDLKGWVEDGSTGQTLRKDFYVTDPSGESQGLLRHAYYGEWENMPLGQNHIILEDENGEELDVARASAPRSNELNKFAKTLGDEVKSQREYAELLSRNHDWAYEVGDTLMSTHSGETYEVVGRSFTGQGEKVSSGKLNATYAMKTGGNVSLMREDRILASKTMKSLTRPFTKLSNPRSTLGTLTADQEVSLRNVGGITEPRTWRQWAKDAKETWAMKAKQGLFDQFASIAKLDQHAYMLSRLSKGSEGTLEASLMYGMPTVDAQGVANVKIDPAGGVVKRLLAPLQGEHDRFLWWVAALRAERLKAEGKENLFTDADISNLKALKDGAMKDGKSRAGVYVQQLAELNRINDEMLAFTEASGLTDAETRAVFKDQPYVPFYRVMEDGLQGQKFSSGLVNQKAWKKLKGGKEKLNADLLQNYLLNLSHLFKAAANNRAAAATMDAAVKAGIAERQPHWQDGQKGTVKVMEGGKAVSYVVDDPYVLEAVSAIEYTVPAFFKPFATFKRMLTVGVTANPAFKIRNLIRDSIAAIGQSDLSLNPGRNIKEGWAATNRASQTYASMLASGGSIHFGAALEADGEARVRRAIRHAGGEVLDAKGFDALAAKLGDLWEAYQELGDRGENVNRAALYQQLIAKGKTHEEASFMSRDLLDFSMSGRWPVVRFLASTVPFLNARLQGLYKLGRSGAENPRRLGAIVGAVSLASVALMLAYEDDEDWKKREDWDRDTSWWFKIGDVAFRIPKPFEIGAVGTLAERTLELFTSPEMNAKRYGQRVSNMIFQTFSFDPTPQILKPLLDVYSNKDSFTGRAIESAGMERLRPQDRANEHTSQVAVLLGQLGLPNPADLAKGQWNDLSPQQLDFLVRGYFGWLGTSAMTALDWGLRPLAGKGERPDLKLRDVFLAGSFTETLPANSSRYLTKMYDEAKAIEQAYASYHDALKRGDAEGAVSIWQSEKDKIAQYKAIEGIKRSEAALNAKIKVIEASKSMDGATKRRLIDLLSGQKNKIAEAAMKPR